MDNDHKRYTEADYAQSMEEIMRDLPSIADCKSTIEFAAEVYRVAAAKYITGIAVVFVTEKGVSPSQFGCNTNDLMSAGIVLCKWAEEDSEYEH